MRLILLSDIKSWYVNCLNDSQQILIKYNLKLVCRLTTDDYFVARWTGDLHTNFQEFFEYYEHVELFDNLPVRPGRPNPGRPASPFWPSAPSNPF